MKSTIIKGTVVLTLATLIIKILSASYRIPYQNFVGDIGYYVYQQAYPFYAVFLLLVTQGFPVVLSKLFIEAREKSLELEIYTRKYVKKILIVFSVFCFCSLFIFSKNLSYFMGDSYLSPVIRMISFVYLLLPFLAFKRGVYQSYYTFVPTAISQLVEQTIRVTIIILSAVILSSLGYSVYKVAEGAFLGAFIGGAFALVVLTSYTNKPNTTIKKSVISKRQQNKMRKNFYIYTFSIGTTCLLMVLFQLAESINLYKLLLINYSELEAKTLKGVYDRAWPLIQLGLVIATSLALNIIPVITSEKTKEKQLETICSAVKFTVMISLAASIGLIAIMKPTNMFLFTDTKGTLCLQVLALCIFFGSIIITLSSILQGLGDMFTCAIAIIIGFLLKILLNVWMVPHFGLLGAATTTVVLLATIAIYLYYVVNKKLEIQCLSITMWVKIIVITLIMGGSILYITNQLVVVGRLQHAVLAISCAIIGVIIFVVGILVSNVLTPKEREVLPLLNKIKRR